MNDHYLKFDTEAAAVAAMGTGGLAVNGVIPEGPVWTAHGRVDIHVVGTVYKPDENGAPVAQPGFHVNLRGALPDALSQYAVFPDTPAAVWS